MVVKNLSTGYQGKVYEMPVTLKPGDTQRGVESKFSTAGGTIISPQRVNAPARTSYGQDHAAVQQHSYTVPDRRGVSVSWAVDPSKNRKPFIGGSTFGDSFSAQKLKMQEAQEKTEHEWLTASRKVSTHTVRQAPVQSGYTKDFCAKKLQSGNLQSSTLDLMEGTSNATRHVPGYQGHIPANSSNGNAGHHPDKRTMASRSHTADLMEGTTKAGDHIPGYRGHIPVHHRNVGASANGYYKNRT